METSWEFEMVPCERRGNLEGSMGTCGNFMDPVGTCGNIVGTSWELCWNLKGPLGTCGNL